MSTNLLSKLKNNEKQELEQFQESNDPLNPMDLSLNNGASFLDTYKLRKSPYFNEESENGSNDEHKRNLIEAFQIIGEKMPEKGENTNNQFAAIKQAVMPTKTTTESGIEGVSLLNKSIPPFIEQGKVGQRFGLAKSPLSDTDQLEMDYQSPLEKNVLSPNNFSSLNSKTDEAPAANPQRETEDSFWGGFKQDFKQFANDFEFNYGLAKSMNTEATNLKKIGANLQSNADKYLNMPSDRMMGEKAIMEHQIKSIEHPTYITTPGGPIRPPVKKTFARLEDLKESKQALDYLEQLQKIYGNDNDKITEIINRTAAGKESEGYKQMEEALEKEDEFPELTGWGSVGNFTGGALRQSIPYALAAATGGTLAPIIASVTSATSNASQENAEIQKEMMRYERETGREIPSGKKISAAAGHIASGLATDIALQSRFARNLMPKTKIGDISDKVTNKLITDPTKRKQAAEMIRDYMNERPAGNTFKNGLINDALLAGGSAASTSMLQDANQRIYKDAEDLLSASESMKKAANSALYGTVAGGAMGLPGRINRNKMSDKTISFSKTPNTGPIRIIESLPNRQVLVKTSKGKQMVIPQSDIKEIAQLEENRYLSINQKRAYDNLKHKKEYRPEAILDRIYTENSPFLPELDWKDATPFQKEHKVNRMAKDMNVVVDSYLNIPNNVGGIVTGQYLPASKEVHVNTFAANNPEEIQNTLNHEIYGHAGPENMNRGKLLKRKNDLYLKKAIPEKDKEALRMNGYDEKDIPVEYVAHKAEEGLQKPTPREWVNGAIGWATHDPKKLDDYVKTQLWLAKPFSKSLANPYKDGGRYFPKEYAPAEEINKYYDELGFSQVGTLGLIFPTPEGERRVSPNIIDVFGDKIPGLNKITRSDGSYYYSLPSEKVYEYEDKLKLFREQQKKASKK